MKTCSTCGLDLPESEFWRNQQNCKACARSYMKAYRAANSDRISEYTKQYRSAHRELVRIWQAQFRLRHPNYRKWEYQARKEELRAYARRNRDRINERERARPRKKLYQSAYQRANRNNINARHRRDSESLTDSAVTRILLHSFRQSGLTWVRAKHIPESLIQLKRVQLQITRKLKEMQKR